MELFYQQPPWTGILRKGWIRALLKLHTSAIYCHLAQLFLHKYKEKPPQEPNGELWDVVAGLQEDTAGLQITGDSYKRTGESAGFVPSQEGNLRVRYTPASLAQSSENGFLES